MPAFSKSLPTLTTERLRLRPFAMADAPEVVRLAGDVAVAAGTLSIPHPYPPKLATEWIASHQSLFQQGQEVVLAITRPERTLIGSIGLDLTPEYQLAELGYWVGRPYWGQGYCTEAARAIMAYGFEELGLNRIQATHFSDNPASGRVMEKIGLIREGYRPRYTLKNQEFKDIVLYGLLRSSWPPAP